MLLIITSAAICIGVRPSSISRLESAPDLSNILVSVGWWVEVSLLIIILIVFSLPSTSYLWYIRKWKIVIILILILILIGSYWLGALFPLGLVNPRGNMKRSLPYLAASYMHLVILIRWCEKVTMERNYILQTRGLAECDRFWADVLDRLIRSDNLLMGQWC